MDADGVFWSRGPMLGKGSFGCVFIATLKKPKTKTTPFPRVMAVKSTPFSASASLQKEKEILDNLRGCPFVLRCFGEEGTMGDNTEMTYNMLLEYASGGDLADVINKSNGCGLPKIEVRHYTRCILEGLRHIHDCGYVHCDLKPDNILLVDVKGGKFVAKIGDLGLAKRARQSKKQKIGPSLRGTPQYLAPEIVIECLQEAPSDIWALGCVVLEMLTGKQAWEMNPNYKVEEVLQMIGDEHSLPKIPIGISKEGKDFLKRCFVRKPMFRFTAEMLLDHSFVQGLDEKIFKDVSWSEYIEEEDECDSFEEAASRIKRSNAGGELNMNYTDEEVPLFDIEADPSLSSCSEYFEEYECDSFEEAASGIQRSYAGVGELKMDCSDDAVSLSGTEVNPQRSNAGSTMTVCSDTQSFLESGKAMPSHVCHTCRCKMKFCHQDLCCSCI